jgi:hypothetical protein
MVVVVVTTLASFYGQLRFRSWAPSLAVSSTLAGLLLSCFTGPILQSVWVMLLLVRRHVERDGADPALCQRRSAALFWPQAAAATVDTAGLRPLELGQFESWT